MHPNVKRFTKQSTAWNFKRVVASATLAAASTTLLAVPASSETAPAAESVQRAAGSDRIGTAVAASRHHRVSAQDVLIATAGSFPDALGAGALARRLQAPLLLTARDHLAAAVAEEIARLGAANAWLLGGTAAVSPQVEQELAALGLSVRRLAGASRYDTAALVALEAGPSGTGEVVLALGEHADPARAWPDAVAAGALAATPDAVPTLLTHPDALPQETIAALEQLNAATVVILGGETAITPAVEQDLAARGYATRRVAGASRYDTSIELAEEALARFDATTQPAVFASGDNFPDALAAGALAAGLGAPLLLVPSQSLAPQSEAFVRTHEARLAGGVVVGGPASATEYVVAQLDAAVRGAPAPPAPVAPAEAEPQPAVAPEDEVVSAFEGTVSWYGPGFAGRPTASGEPFNPNDLTAAHRSLPFGTRLRITNLANGLVVTVRINDRGPVNRNWAADLSSAAADVLDYKQEGTAHVRAEVLAG